MLNKLNNLVVELQQTSSTLEKKQILKKYNNEDIKTLLKFVYSNYIQFHVTSKNLIKRQDLIEDNNLSIIQLLTALDELEFTGHKAIAMVNGFITRNNQYKDLVYCIIDKNLKTRTDAKLINDVYPNLIPTFDVALADDYSKKSKFVDFKKQKWLASQKIDGCRCLVFNKKHGVVIYARSGKEFTTLDVIKNEFMKLQLPEGVYDGEICIVDADGNEQFSGIMKEIKRKDHTIQNPRYKMFDHISFKEFEDKEGFVNFKTRYDNLKKLFSTIKSPYIDLLEQVEVKDEAHFEQLKAEASDKNWEGLIIRENVGYEGKRSRHMLKVKAFFDGEFKIEGTYPTRKRMFINGIEKEMDCMGGIYIFYEGYRVDVGSGWSDEERLQYYAHPEEIIGKQITVQWFEPTENMKGTTSMRFPTKKWIYGEERDV